MGPAEPGIPPAGTGIAAAQVMAALDCILADKRFRKSASLSRFLRYIVTEALEGRAQGLKESILGTAVFDRGGDFDPRIDAIVRVQATKLRVRLQEYYAAEGLGSPIVIELPKGTYVPSFRLAVEEKVEEAEQATQAPAQPLRTRRGTFSQLWLSGAMLLGLIAVATAVAFYRTRPVDNAAPLRFTQLTYDRGSTAFPVLSRDGKLLVYASDRESNHFSIWGQRIGGGAPERITNHDSDDLTPDLSPDGTLVVYRSRAYGGGLFLKSLPDGVEKRIAEQAWLPRFSPDGSWISCMSAKPGGGGALLVIPVSGGRPYEITMKGTTPLSAPVWSPDSRSLLFVGVSDADGEAADVDWRLAPRVGGQAVPVGLARSLALAGLGAPDGETIPGDWSGDSIVFSLRRASSSGIWKVRMNLASNRIEGPPVPITSGSAAETYPRFGAAGNVLFTSEELQHHVHAIPLDAATGLAAGDAERITEQGFPRMNGIFPTLSQSGQHLLFTRLNLGTVELVRRDLAAGRDTVVASVGQPLEWPLFSSDARTVLFRGASPQQGAIHVADEGKKDYTRNCEECGPLQDWSDDGRWLLHGNPSRSSLMITAWPHGPTVEWLRHAPQRVSHAVFSPAARLVAMALEGSGGFVVPFDPRKSPARRDWVLVAEESDVEHLDWSPDGSLLYYFSRRDGHLCLWARRVAADSGRPVGTPISIQHFHMPRPSPWSRWLSVGRGRAAFVATEPRANIWMVSSPSGHL